jgi:hypothetical protein
MTWFSTSACLPAAAAAHIESITAASGSAAVLEIDSCKNQAGQPRWLRHCLCRYLLLQASLAGWYAILLSPVHTTASGVAAASCRCRAPTCMSPHTSCVVHHNGAQRHCQRKSTAAHTMLVRNARGHALQHMAQQRPATR